jgi:hypothetical protein
MCALILLSKLHTFRIWVYTWLVMLSHAVLSVVQVFHVYDVEYGLCLSVRDVVFHPSRRNLAVWDRCCGLNNGWNGRDG